MNQYISICGLSAAGKKTLIGRLLRDEGGARERFSVRGPVEAFGYSFAELERIHRSGAASVLHQWQWTSDSMIEELCSRHPDSRHRVVVIWRRLDEQYRDIVSTYGDRWKPTYESLVENWNRRIVPRFRDEISPHLGIEVELVDGSTTDLAALRRWPVA